MANLRALVSNSLFILWARFPTLVYRRWMLCAPCLALGWLALLLASTSAPSFAQAPKPTNRVALLIGNANYSDGLTRLTNPPNDVARLERALKALNFTVLQPVLNGDHKAMQRAVRDFGDRARNAEMVFFYYSGHGMQSGGENYLLPIGAVINKEADLGVEALALSNVMRQLEDASPRLAVIVLDACRDNPLPGRTKSGAKGLARVERTPTNTFIAFAAQPGATATDDGIYARELAASLTSAQSLRQAFDRVGREVDRATNGKQRPRKDDGLNEDVLLNPAPTSSRLPAQVSGGAPGATGGARSDDLQKSNPSHKVDAIATVNGFAIPRKVFDVVVASRANSYTINDGRPLKVQVRGELIELETFYQEFLRLTGGTRTNLLPKNDAEVRMYLSIRTEAKSWLVKHLRSKLTDSQIQALYLKRTRGLIYEYRARHILLPSYDEAKSIVDRLNAGEDFASLAKNSLDLGTKDSGGDLDWSPAERFVPEIAQVLRGLNNGEFTRVPVKTAFGYHVIRKDDTRLTEKPPLVSMIQGLQAELIDDALKDLLWKATVQLL